MNAKSIKRPSRASRTKPKTGWRRFDALTDRKIASAIATDPDAAPSLDEAWLKKAHLVMPPEKELISIRLDRDVLNHFRARPRYQSRINAILRMVMEGEKTR